MITTPFTDDAFNKYINENERGSTILIGNWYEEQCIRDATGEGRTVAQRHIKRSGLLQDFTKLPSQTRVMDNTFDRVLGRKQTRQESEEVEGTETLNLPTTGLRFERDRAKVIEYANSQMERLGTYLGDIELFPRGTRRRVKTRSTRERIRNDKRYPRHGISSL